MAPVPCNDKAPFNLSNYQVPEAPGGFCKRGGRFGAHASNENQPPMYAKRIVFYAWFAKPRSEAARRGAEQDS